MSPPLPSDDDVLGTAAIRLDAIPGDAVAAGEEALPRQAVVPGKGTVTALCVVDKVVPEPYLYCQEFHGISSDKVVVVSAWKEALDAIFEYQRVATLIIVSHSTGTDVSIGGLQRTFNQIADGDDRLPGFKSWTGSAGTLKLDGCSAGSDPPSLLAFARKIPVGKVEAWSLGRYLNPFALTAEGNRAAVVDDFKGKGYFERSAPYMPKGDTGSTFRADELERELLSDGRFVHFVEVFGIAFAFGLSSFEDLLKQPELPFIEGQHLVRAQGERESVHTDQEASDLFLRVNSSRLALYQVIAEPR